MRRQRSNIYFLVFTIIIMVFLSSCWDSTELNKIAIVAGIGWDIDPDTEEVTFSVQSINPREMKASSGSSESSQQQGGGALRVTQLDQDTGPSMYDAIARLSQHVSRFPFYEHAVVYIFGKEGAKHGIYPFIDVQARNPDSRPTVLIVVSAEDKATDIMQIQDGMENIQAMGMADEIKLSAHLSKYPAVTVLDFQQCILSKTTAPIAPIVGIVEETGPGGKKIPKIRVAGTAVFKLDKMIGQLNERESSGLLWAIDKIKKGFVAIPDANLEIVKSKSKIIPEMQDGKIKMTIEIDEEADLILYKGRQDITDELLQKFEKDQAKEIESQVMAAVKKSFALNADIFGFGEAVHRKYKKEWKDLQSRWDEIYTDIEVVVKVKTHLNEIGEITKALIKE